MNNLPNLSNIIFQTFNALINQCIMIVPRVFGCIIIMLIGYLVAKASAIIIRKVLSSIGFDRIGDKLNEISLIKQLKTEIRLSGLVSMIAYYFILLIFLTAAAETLGVDAVTSIVLSLVNFIPKLIAAAIMLQIGIMVANVIKSAVISTCKSFNIASARLIGNITFSFFLVITFISASGQIGIETALLKSTFILIIGGVILSFSVGYGVASKDVLTNMISSFYSRKKYREGQVILVNDVKGTITKIDSMSITLVNEGVITVVPLQIFQTHKVEIFN